MKILALADKPVRELYNEHRRPDLAGIDLILSCGDLPAEYLSFLSCFCNVPILYVCGNHDDYAKKPPEGCICIEDKVYVHNGIRILGLGGSMRYKDGDNQYTQNEMNRRIRTAQPQIRRKKGIDILLTHAPAYQIGDDRDLAHTGFLGFVALMDRYEPQYLVHGHVHQEYTYRFQRERTYNSTTILNACGKVLFDIDAPASPPPSRVELLRRMCGKTAQNTQSGR